MPLNPQEPPPILRNRVTTAVRTAAHKNRNGIEMIATGGASGLAVLFITGQATLAAAALLYFLLGAFVQKAALGAK